MGYYADIYIIKKTRSKKIGFDFLDHFLPLREESASEYLIPQFANSPNLIFEQANELMTFLESNENYSQSIYWRNTDKSNLNKHGMIFYTKDGYMIFGISRNTFDTINPLHADTKNEDECLELMKKYFDSHEGYITYECPPDDTYEEFKEQIKANKKDTN